MLTAPTCPVPVPFLRGVREVSVCGGVRGGSQAGKAQHMGGIWYRQVLLGMCHISCRTIPGTAVR